MLWGDTDEERVRSGEGRSCRKIRLGKCCCCGQIMMGEKVRLRGASDGEIVKLGRW